MASMSTALTMPTPGEVANRRVAQFTQQVVDIIKGEKLDFFFDVVRRMEGEQDIAAREIAAALAWLATRERPLQMPGANDHAPRDAALWRGLAEQGALSNLLNAGAYLGGQFLGGGMGRALAK